MTPAGHLRFLTLEEHIAYSTEPVQFSRTGIHRLSSHLHVLVEVERQSMEHALCLSSSYHPKPEELESWSISALYFAAENFFVTERLEHLRELVLRKPEVAKLLLSAVVYGGGPRISNLPQNRYLLQAQDFVRMLFAASAARAALGEIEK